MRKLTDNILKLIKQLIKTLLIVLVAAQISINFVEMLDQLHQELEIVDIQDSSESEDSTETEDLHEDEEDKIHNIHYSLNIVESNDAGTFGLQNLYYSEFISIPNPPPEV